MNNKLFRVVHYCWLLCILVFTGCTATISGQPSLALGKKIAFERSKGNCLACHAIDDGEEPGTIGQPLNSIAAQYKNKAELRQHLWDQTRYNPDTSMPPFGRNKILTEQEIDHLVEYLWAL